MAVNLVTGANGFIGRYAVRRLLARGDAVRVLVRRPEALPDDVRRRVEIVAGDIRDGRAVAAAVRGAHTVLHLAALAKAWCRDARQFTEVNVTAVEQLLALARAAQVERLVHVSTIVTLPPYAPAPLRGNGAARTPYEASKRAAERLVEAYAAAGRHAVIVHPTRVYGPGPLHDANGVTKAIALFLRGRLRVRLADRDAQASYVHADDVAAGILLAAERGAAGAHYVLGGDNVSFRELLRSVEALAGVRRRTVPLPPRVALAAARGAELLARLGVAPLVTPGWVRVFLEDRRAGSESARRELGYRPRPLPDGLRETIAWLVASGAVSLP